MVREYIGARYVPKFMGLYDATQEYEALCVVDNGMGTSYITKIPTPAGTPLTDTTYWFIYGASSGAIINLQNQIGDLTDLDTTDKDTLVDAINENVSKINDVRERTEDIFNVASLGLDLTQDITSDIEAALATHKRLYFPAGTYKFSITISSQYNEIFGDGFNTIFRPTTSACITLNATGGVNSGDNYFHDFKIVSDRSKNGIQAIGLYGTDPINNCIFENIFIESCNYGIKWDARGIWCKFKNIWCIYGNYGLSVSTPNSCAFNANSFTDCFFGYNQYNAVIMAGNTTYSINTIKFDHCTFEGNFQSGTPSFDMDVMLTKCNSIMFTDCYFEANNGTATFWLTESDIVITGGVSISPTSDLIGLTSTGRAIIIGFHGYNASTHQVVGNNLSNVCIIGQANIDYTIVSGTTVLY